MTETVVAFEALREVDVFDGDVALIKAADGLEVFLPTPEQAEANPGKSEVWEDGGSAGEDAKGPALGEDEGTARADFSGTKVAQNLGKCAWVHPAICITSDEDFPAGGGDSGVADFRKIARILADDEAAGGAGDGLCSIAATIENDDGLDGGGWTLAAGDFHGGEAGGEKRGFVVSRDDEGDAQCFQIRNFLTAVGQDEHR